MSASVLFVCTGNICRSPFAAVYLQASLSDVAGLVVGSAGTYANKGDEMTEEMKERARAIGVDPSGHRSRYLVESQIESSDLNLALTRAHRGEIVKMVPRKLLVTFTLREFARLAASATDAEIRAAASSGASDGERIKAAARLLAARRSNVDPAMLEEDDDVIDPYRREPEVYDLSVSQMIPALDATARVLRLVLSR